MTFLSALRWTAGVSTSQLLSHTGHTTLHLLTVMTNWSRATHELVLWFRNLLAGRATRLDLTSFCVCVCVCMTLTCAFVWNSVAFHGFLAQLTRSVRLGHQTFVTLPLHLLRLRSPFLLFSVFAFLFVFMLFWLLPGLVAAGCRTTVLRALQDRVPRWWCASAGCWERYWAREQWRRLAEPLGSRCFLRVTVFPVMAGVIADIRQCFKRTRDVQHRELLDAGCHSSIWHGNSHPCLCSTCVSSPAGGTQFAIDRGCCSLAGEVWYSGLFVDKGVDKVSSRSFLKDK